MKYYTVENNKKSITKTFAIYYICMAVFVGLKIFVSSVSLPEEKWVDVFYSVLVQAGIVFLLPLFLYCVFIKVSPKKVFKTCNFTKTTTSVVFISLGLGVICFFINVVVSSLSNGIITFSGYRQVGVVVAYEYSFVNFLLDMVTIAVLPAVCEEFLHRGLILQGTKHMGFKKAILVSAILFALLHFSIQKVFYAFVVGLILGLVAVVAKNIWPAIIIHFVNNAISVYLDYASAHNWFLGDLLNDLNTWLVSTDFVLVFCGSLLFVIVIIALLILFVWLLYKQAMLGKVKRALDKVYNASDLVSSSKVVINRNSIFHDLLEKNTLLNLNYRPKDNPIDVVLPKEKSVYKLSFKDRIFLSGAIVLGLAITIFTYIWGLL